MRTLLVLVALLSSTAYALTQAEIDSAAKRANNGLRSVVKKLASEKLAGRDNDTPASLDAQTYLIRRLRRLGAGMNGGVTDDADYKQPFTYLGQTGTNLLAVMPGTDLAGRVRDDRRALRPSRFALDRHG